MLDFLIRKKSIIKTSMKFKNFPRDADISGNAKQRVLVNLLKKVADENCLLFILFKNTNECSKSLT